MLVRHITGGPVMHATPSGDGYLCRWMVYGEPFELEFGRDELQAVRFEPIPPKPKPESGSKVVEFVKGGE